MRRTGFKKPKQPKCKNCKQRFEGPPWQEICSDTCREEAYQKAVAKLRSNQEKAIKKSRQDQRKISAETKVRIKSAESWRNDLQKIFNEYIRLRDKDLPCISCGTTKAVQYCAGHYYTRKAFPNLRYNEDN